MSIGNVNRVTASFDYGMRFVHEITLTPTLFIEVSVPSHEKNRPVCVEGIEFSSFYDFSIEIWNCSDSVVFLAFHFYYF
jgi:hypothetical protein